MQLHTYGHACLLLENSAGESLLATDPWLFGSSYWRSWWLQNPPTDAQIARIAEARYLYLTHEHPDHLHLPSLRRIGTRPQVLMPDFLCMSMDQHLIKLGYSVRRLRSHTWEPLENDVQVMALPQEIGITSADRRFFYRSIGFNRLALIGKVQNKSLYFGTQLLTFATETLKHGFITPHLS